MLKTTKGEFGVWLIYHPADSPSGLFTVLLILFILIKINNRDYITMFSHIFMKKIKIFPLEHYCRIVSVLINSLCYDQFMKEIVEYSLLGKFD